MAIIQSYIDGGHTKLNKLKYGEYPNIGNEPAIQKSIPSSIDSNIPKADQATRRVNDLQRIAKIFTQKPGLKYLLNETALNAVKINSKLSPKETKAGNIINSIGSNLWNTVKIIGSTLAQVPLSGTGVHFVKGFAGKGKYTYLQGLDVPAHILARQGSPVIQDIDGRSPYNAIVHEIGDNPLDESGPASLVASKLRGAEEKSQYALTGDRLQIHFPTESTVKKENRLLLGDPAKRKTYGYDSYYGAPKNVDTVDRINALAPYKGELKGIEETRDIIKFRFEIVNPTAAANKDGKKIGNNTFLHFRAFLDSFTDNYSGNWQSNQYVGRGENFYNYSGFDRSISLGFKISAQSRFEMRPLYQKMIMLASTTAPSYSAAGYMRGTFVKTTVGSYLENMPCIITSVNYTWEQDYQWEIAMNGPESKNSDKKQDFDQQELPMTLACSLNLIPLHTFTPQTGLYPYFTKTSTNSDSSFIEPGGENKEWKIKQQPTVK